MGLAEYLRDHGISIRNFATSVGANEQVVYRLVRGAVPRDRSILDRVVTATEGAVTMENLISRKSQHPSAS